MPLGWTRHEGDADCSAGRFAELDVSTPAVILREYLGMLPYSPPYLAQEMESMHGAVLGHVELSQAMDTIGGREDIPLKDLVQGLDPDSSKQLRIHKNQNLRLLSPRSLLHGPASVTGDMKLQIDGGSGRRALSVAEYVSKSKLEALELVVSPADEVNMESTGKNRSGRALERTDKFFGDFYDLMQASAKGDEESRDAFLFKTVVASTKPGALEAQLQAGDQSDKDRYHGVAAGSTNLGESDKAFGSHIGSIRAMLPRKALLVQACNSLGRILLSLEKGADLISSDLPSLLTKKGHALALDWTSISQQARSTVPEDGEPSAKRQKTASLDEATGPTEEARAVELSPAVMDLWDERYLRDKSPLMDGCECHACVHHTRAYIHHLLKSKELLAEVLLHAHNQHQLLILFQQARLHLDHSKAGSGHLATQRTSEIFHKWIAAIRNAYIID